MQGATEGKADNRYVSHLADRNQIHLPSTIISDPVQPIELATQTQTVLIFSTDGHREREMVDCDRARHPRMSLALPLSPRGLRSYGRRMGGIYEFKDSFIFFLMNTIVGVSRSLIVGFLSWKIWCARFEEAKWRYE